MHIKLHGNVYLNSDAFQYWIASETKVKNKNGEDTVRSRRLTGYHSDFEKLFNDYFDRAVRSSEIDGEIADLAKLIKKTRADIQKWMKQMRGDDRDD